MTLVLAVQEHRAGTSGTDGRLRDRGRRAAVHRIAGLAALVLCAACVAHRGGAVAEQVATEPVIPAPATSEPALPAADPADSGPCDAATAPYTVVLRPLPRSSRYGLADSFAPRGGSRRAYALVREGRFLPGEYEVEGGSAGLLACRTTAEGLWVLYDQAGVVEGAPESTARCRVGAMDICFRVLVGEP